MTVRVSSPNGDSYAEMEFGWVLGVVSIPDGTIDDRRWLYLCEDPSDPSQSTLMALMPGAHIVHFGNKMLQDSFAIIEFVGPKS